MSLYDHPTTGPSAAQRRSVLCPPIAQMTPQELAHDGIPVVVALRARIEEIEGARSRTAYWETRRIRYGAQIEAYRDALAIIEAKR